MALVLTLHPTLLSHMSDQDMQDFSLQYQYNINQTSCENICFGYFFDWANQKIHYHLYSNRLKFSNFREFHVIQSNKEKGEEGRAQALKDLMATNIIVINELCVYFWVCHSEDNIHMREVHVDNYKYENELAFFIQLLNKTTFQEIGARKTVTIENPLLDSPTEEEVANDVIRVDVRHS